MELDSHLMNVAQVLNNIKDLERNGGMTALIFDLKKIVEAVNYLLETSTLREVGE